MTTPSPARTVLAVGAAARSNGTDIAPAVITRVWSQREDGVWLVNATLLPDATSLITWVTSVYLYASEEQARAANGDNDAMTSLYWPARV